MKTISWDCPACQKLAVVPIKTGALVCPHCQENCGRVDDSENFPEFCPRCSCTQFYLVRNFNQSLGCLIMLLGIILVPRTYGLSLPALALLDWLIFRRIPSIGICYRCKTEFRGFIIPKDIKPFVFHVGAKYDRKRRY